MDAPFLRSPAVTQVNDHIWLMDDNQEATWFVVAGKEKAMVIDTSIGMSAIRAEAAKVTNLPVICVNTHGHGDHMGGNWSFDKAYMHPADLPLAEETINYPELKNALEQFGLGFPPFEPVEDGQVFDLGGLVIEAIHFPGHTPGEIVLLDRQDRILFSGDGILEHLWLQLEESLPVETQIASMEKLLPLRDQFDTILHGHCHNPRSAKLFDALLAALRNLAAGNTAGDVDYPWHGYVSRAYPYAYEDEPRCFIVHK